MQNSNRQIKIGGIISYLTISFSIIAGLIFTPWMISNIGQSDFGLFTLVSSLIVMTTIDIGLSEAVTRFVSKYRAENDKESIKKFLGVTYKLFFLLSLVFLFLLMVVYLNVDKIFLKLSLDEIEKVKILLLIAGSYAIISFPFNPLDGLLVSGEWFIFQKSTELINKVLYIGLMVIALLMGYGVYSLVVVNAVVGLTVIVLKYLFLKKNDPYTVQWSGFDKILAREMFTFSIWIMVIKLAHRFIMNITPSILGITSGSKEIAIYSAALTIEGYVWTFAMVISSMLLPKVSKLIYGENAKPDKLQALMIKVGRLQFIILAGIVSIFIVAGNDFFLNWLGPNFEKSYLVAVFLIFPGLITIPQSIASTALIATNQVKFNAYSRLIIAAISMILSYILSLKYGATGSGLGIFIGNMIGGVIVLNIIYARVLKINIWTFFKECQMKMSFPFILVLFSGLALNYYIIDVSWINLFVKVSTLLLIYIVSSYIYALNNYEKGLIKGVVNRII